MVSLGRKSSEILKKYGLKAFIKKFFHFVKRKFLEFQKIRRLTKLEKQEIENVILSNRYDFIDLFVLNFGWNVQMYQRPQHVAINMSNIGGLVLYNTSYVDLDVKTIKKAKENLYLVNLSNPYVLEYLLETLKTVNKLKLCHTYAGDMQITLKDFRWYEDMGFKILYEYVDEISEAISGRQIPEEQYKKHDYILKNTQHYVVASADKLDREVQSIRGDKNHIFACNGVDYEHWQKKFNLNELPEDIKKIRIKEKTILGYYGALATWFDYELIVKLAKERPEYEIVLIGIKYDDSYEKYNLDALSNVHFLGSKDYKILNQYAFCFDVAIIPFVINDVTESTSPIKLFEYMAAGKPIVTTALPECKKYKSALIGENHDDFITKIDLAIKMKNHTDYIDILKKEALENTWEKKTRDIVDMLYGNV